MKLEELDLRGVPATDLMPLEECKTLRLVKVSKEQQGRIIKLRLPQNLVLQVLSE
jgi:hypothetical protein